MTHRYGKTFFLFFFIPLIVDRITKYLVVSGTLPDQQVGSFLDIYLTYNRGISWGVGNSSHQGQFILISCVVAAVILGFVWYIYKTNMKQAELGLCLLILSGALSNFYDRIMHEGVIDFILFHWGDWSFPVFNIADAFISVGTCLLLYVFFKQEFAP